MVCLPLTKGEALREMGVSLQEMLGKMDRMEEAFAMAVRRIFREDCPHHDSF